MTISTVTHTIEPVYNAASRVLILGTIPSPKSREAGFYYSHPQNMFWSVIAEVFSISAPVSNAEKKQFLLDRRIAMWDVLKSCEISGADDGSIKNPVANDFSELLATANIRKIYTTGMTATRLYKKLCFTKTGIESIYLPSTSPANRKYYDRERLVQAYMVIKDLTY